MASHVRRDASTTVRVIVIHMYLRLPASLTAGMIRLLPRWLTVRLG